MHLVIILVAAVFIMICLAVLGSQTLPALLHRVLFLNAGFTGSGKPSSITIAKILGIYTSEKGGKKGRDAAIGFVLTVKSSARYDKIAKEPLSSEYYLLGTLLSVALAVIIGSGVSGGVNWRVNPVGILGGMRLGYSLRLAVANKLKAIWGASALFAGLVIPKITAAADGGMAMQERNPATYGAHRAKFRVGPPQGTEGPDYYGLGPYAGIVFAKRCHLFFWPTVVLSAVALL